MTTGGTLVIIIIAALIALTAVAVWFIWRPYRQKSSSKPGSPAETVVDQPLQSQLIEQAEDDIEHIFNEEFREELRNRGRLHFEKVIGENAMFLQQDLRETTTQLNEYMRTEITKTLQEEFKKYQQSITDAKQLALDSIEKTVTTIEQQRHFLESQLQAQAEAQKSRIVNQFEKEMASVINHYILRAIGNQIDLSDQLEYILAELEANKPAIIEDVKNGI